MTHTSTATGTTTTALATSALVLGVAATVLAFTALGASLGRTSWLRLAGELNGDLAVEDGLAVQLVDGTLGLRRRGDVNEGVADWAGRAWVGGD